SQRGARHLKKGSRVLCQGAQVKYAFVRANRQEFHVTRMGQVLQVSRSGYYDWQVRKECERSRQDGVLLKKIRKIHLEMKEAYGATKTWRTLQQSGTICGKHRVARLRRAAGIEAPPPPQIKIPLSSTNQ